MIKKNVIDDLLETPAEDNSLSNATGDITASKEPFTHTEGKLRNKLSFPRVTLDFLNVLTLFLRQIEISSEAP